MWQIGSKGSWSSFSLQRSSKTLWQRSSKGTRQECIQDGIDWAKVDFEDNQACLGLFEKVSSPTVREEFAKTVISAIGLFASTELPLQRAILPSILQMLYDPNPGVREAAILCIEEIYAQIWPQFREELQHYDIPSSMVIILRLEFQFIYSVFSSAHSS